MVKLSLTISQTILDQIKHSIVERIAKGEYTGLEDPFLYVLVSLFPELEDLKKTISALDINELINALLAKGAEIRSEPELVEILDWLLVFILISKDPISISKNFVIFQEICKYVNQQKDISIQIIFELFTIIFFSDFETNECFKEEFGNIIENVGQIPDSGDNHPSQKFLISIIVQKIADVLKIKELKLDQEKTATFFEKAAVLDVIPYKIILLLNKVFKKNLFKDGKTLFTFYQLINKKALSTLYEQVINEIASVQDSIFFILIMIISNVDLLEIEQKVSRQGKTENIEYPYERETFFEESLYSIVPKDVGRLLSELETCFNDDCLIASGFLIRRIFETSLHLKARMDNKIDEFKKGGTDFIKLEEFSEVAAQIGYISKSHIPLGKTLVKFGDDSVHNFKVKTNKEDVREQIKNLRVLLQEIFFQIKN